MSEAVTPQQYAKIRKVFFEVCELTPLERSAVLDERCADDAELRRAVELLLSEEDATAMLRDSRLGQMGRLAGALFEQYAERLPRTIAGKYRLTRRIGEGGMAVVYEAQQENPWRTVAVKLLRPELVTEAMMRRFTHEAQVLARLQHPTIAQIHDAGIDSSEDRLQPFFVMELVQGEPLVAYAQQRSLSSRARLELLAQVADAVHHAHIKGVIHRDLKPSNILVVDHDDDAHTQAGAKRTLGRAQPPSAAPGHPPKTSAQPKILDFGVACAIEGDIAATTLHTNLGQLVGTVPYMSPEQACGDIDQIDTRSDVYALGVVGYELLTGRLPYDLTHAKLHEAVRIIREVQPLRLNSINPAFAGDLETVISKALEKDKERRYASAYEFASDIRRYLNDEPIIARPASAVYQLRKFAKRNKALVGGVAAVILTLAVGVAATGYWLIEALRQRDAAWQAQTKAAEHLAQTQLAHAAARKEADKARAVTAFFQELIRSASPHTTLGQPLTVQQLLDQSAHQVADRLGTQPEVLAAIQSAIGAAYLELGAAAQALPFLESSLEMQRTLLGDKHAETLRSIELLATCFLKLDRFDEADRILQTHLPASFVNEVAPGTEELWNAFGRVRHEQGRWQEAERVLRAVMDYEIARRGAIEPEMHPPMQNLAMVLADLGRFDDAEELYRQILDNCRDAGRDLHPRTLMTMSALGNLLQRTGKYADACDIFETTVESMRKVLGERHPSTWTAKQNLGGVLWELGRIDESERLSREVLQFHQETFGESHSGTLHAKLTLATALVSKGNFEEAEHLLHEALDAATTALGAEHPVRAPMLNMLAQVLRHTGRSNEALLILRDVLEFRERTFGADHPQTISAVNNLGDFCQETGHLDEAVELLTRAVALRTKVHGPRNAATLTAMNNLGLTLRKLGRLPEARTMLEPVLEARIELLGESHPLTIVSLNNIGTLLNSENRLIEAEAIFVRVLELRRRVLGDDHPQTAQALSNLGRTLRKLDRHQDAVPLLLEAMKVREELLPPSHPEIIALLTDLAGSCRALKDWRTAAQYLGRAVEQIEQAQSPDLRRAAAVWTQLGECLLVLEDYAECQAALEQSMQRLAVVDDLPTRTQMARLFVRLHTATGDAAQLAHYQAMLAELTPDASAPPSRASN